MSGDYVYSHAFAKFVGQPPREKMAQKGIDILSNAELISVIIGNGTKKESVSEISNRIIKDYGIAALASSRDYKKLVESLQISSLKAMQITAIVELGRRIFLERKGRRPLLNSPVKVYKLFKHLQNKQREELYVLYCNSRQLLILSELIAIGSVDLVYSSVREIITPAIEYNSNHIILLHNHPSGDPTPSPADLEFTTQVEKAVQLLGITLLDHVIIGGEGYYSLLENDLLAKN